LQRSETDQKYRTKTENSLVYNMRLKSRDIIFISLLFFGMTGVVSWERVDIFVILSFVLRGTTKWWMP